MITFHEMIKGHEDSIKQFYIHSGDYADIESRQPRGSVEEILRFWYANKQDLYRLLGNQLMLEKRVSFTKPTCEMESEMYHVCSTYRGFIMNFLERLAAALDVDDSKIYRWNLSNEHEKFYYWIRAAFGTSELVEGRFEYNGTIKVNEQVIRTSYGQKIMKVIGKVAHALNMEDDFEKFRVAHSMVLNQQKITGTLHLSIHPLDFATASDNNSNWSSCMSWMNNGSYRLGTVEMMNSPVVLCAYLSSDSVPMHIGGADWPSKKWRAWMIVNDDVILVNRHYPYDNTEIAETLIEWVRELAKTNMGWEYGETTTVNNCEVIEFDSNFMYNDVDEGHEACFRENIEQSYLNFSGPANCMWCGEEIDFPSRENSDTLVCRECRPQACCDGCGDSLHDEDIYYGPDGGIYCSDCFNRMFVYCEECDSAIDREDIIEVCLPIEKKFMRETILALPDGDEKTYWLCRYGNLCTKEIFDYYINTEIIQNVCCDCAYHWGLTDLDEDLVYTYNIMAYGRRLGGRYIFNPATVSYETFINAMSHKFPSCNGFNTEESVVLKAYWEYYCKKAANISEESWDLTADSKNFSQTFWE